MCADRLRAHGVRLGLEFVGPHHLRGRRYPFVWDIPQLLGLLDAIERDNVGVLLDSYHWYTTGQKMEELRLLSAERIVHVHINDAREAPEAAHDQERLLPGEGAIDLRAFVAHLRAAGYSGSLSVEVLRKQAPTEPAAEVLERAYRQTRAVIAGAAV